MYRNLNTFNFFTNILLVNVKQNRFEIEQYLLSIILINIKLNKQ